MQAQELINHLEERKKETRFFKKWWVKQILRVVKGIIEKKTEQAADKIVDKITRKI